jgi:hypothetical protein
MIAVGVVGRCWCGAVIAGRVGGYAEDARDRAGNRFHRPPAGLVTAAAMVSASAGGLSAAVGRLGPAAPWADLAWYPGSLARMMGAAGSRRPVAGRAPLARMGQAEPCHGALAQLLSYA